MYGIQTKKQQLNQQMQFENQEIELEYQDMNWKKQRQKYTGWIAQIIQHEVDHCNGIII